METRLESCQPKRRGLSHLIPEIRSESGEILRSLQDINKTFKEQNTVLFRSSLITWLFGNVFQWNNFANTLSPENTENLERPVSQAKILAAFTNMATGKVPSNDGLSSWVHTLPNIFFSYHGPTLILKRITYTTEDITLS